MKTTPSPSSCKPSCSYLHQLHIRLLFVLVFALVSPLSVWAQEDWALAIIVLGGQESADYQKDIDWNVKELARNNQSESKVKISFLREFSNRVVEYHNDSSSQSVPLVAWDALFEVPPVKAVLIPGELKISKPKGQSVLDQPELLLRFFRKIFSRPEQQTLLMIYGHGLGPRGLKVKGLQKLKELLSSTLPKKTLDLLWLESCYMANVETAMELRSLSQFLIASQDSEFTAGAPFYALDEIQGMRPEEAAVHLAKTYIESYSYTHNGEQRGAVQKSPATISVVESKNLVSLEAPLKSMNTKLQKLSSAVKETLLRQLEKVSMEEFGLVDLGRMGLLAEDEAIKSLLELKSDRSLRTSPRIALRPPKNDMLLVYGLQNWTRGFEGDDEFLAKLPKNLRPEKFVLGPAGKKWPARSIHKRIYVSPFAPGVNEFNAFYADPKSLKMNGLMQKFNRQQDFAWRIRSKDESPLVVSGYTQGIGIVGEKYTGLNIVNPLRGLPFVDYVDLEFFRLTGWTQ